MIKLRIAMFQLSGDENLAGCNLIIRRLALFVFFFMLFSLLVVESVYLKEGHAFR